MRVEGGRGYVPRVVDVGVGWGGVVRGWGPGIGGCRRRVSRIRAWRRGEVERVRGVGEGRVRSSVRSWRWRCGCRESWCIKYVRVMPVVSWPAARWSRSSEAMGRVGGADLGSGLGRAEASWA